MGFHFINLCMTLPFFFILIFLSNTGTEANPTYLSHSCPNTTTYTVNSTYESNLDHLLAYLSSNTTSNPEFYNASVGNSVDVVYGLYLCRGDLRAEACRDCVTYATKYIVDLCPKRKVVVVWYDKCMLRYSNRYIFSTMVPDPSASTSSLRIVSEANRFNQLVISTMNDLVPGVSSGTPGAKKFWTKEVNFTALKKLYTLAQCTPDLSGSDCSSCLQQAIPNLPDCCAGREGGRVLLPSCNVGFDLNPFYQLVATIPPPSEQVTTPKGKDQISSMTIVGIVVPISISVIVFIMGYCILKRRVKKKYNAVPEENATNDIAIAESLQFDFATIEIATDMFSNDNKLGEGGFGAVYKGMFPNGQIIAIKRLSKTSTQGAGEFKNEIVLVAKLQHRNLIRLLGFCLEGKEKILIYEYIPNKSLDYFLYEPSRKRQLNWSIRYKIIEGVARGIQYLHEDSQHRIIHRDLKASNILSDQDMNPKIADFGLAKIFGVDQTQGKASRIVGTLGYISPEYATCGQISIKSDIYSFGVLVLEIITGQKVNSFCQSNGEGHLLSHAWRHQRDGTPFELLDPTLGDSYSRDEFIKCLRIGLLCVQHDPIDRPTIGSITIMLNNDSNTLLSPLQPAYFFGSRAKRSMQSKELESNQSRSISLPPSNNEVSITEIHPR